MMVIVTVAKTNNENADPQVHICAAPTLKSSWEGVLQVSVNILFKIKSNHLCVKVFQSQPNTQETSNVFPAPQWVVEVSIQRFSFTPSSQSTPPPLVPFRLLGPSLPKLLLVVLLPKLVRPLLLILLRIACPVPPPVCRRGHPLQWKSSPLWEHLWHPIWRNCSRRAFQEHLLGGWGEQFWSWRASWQWHPHITPLTPPPPKCG